MKEFTIGPNDAGQRLDRFLAKAVPLLPASLAQKYIRIKRIKRNGARVERDTRLEAGDFIPADARLLRSVSLKSEESALTGESAQEDGETVAIHYTYNATNGNDTGSIPAGMMFSANSDWHTYVGLFMSNATTHFVRNSGGFGDAANSFTTFPATSGEKMDIVAFITRKGTGSEIRYVINGTRFRFEKADEEIVDKVTGDAYIGNGWTQMAIWQNSKMYAEVKTLGVLTDEGLETAIGEYCAKAIPNNSLVKVSGNSGYGMAISDFDVCYASSCGTVGALTGKLDFSEGASYGVYASESATEALDNAAAIPAGAVLKITSANEEVTAVYALTEYTDDNITFAEDEENITVTVNDIFSVTDKLFVAVYSSNGASNPTVELIKIGAVADGNLTATISKASAEGKTVKAFYWNKNLVPIATATK